MKKLKALLLTLLSIVFILVLTGCRCNPSEHKWYVERFEISTLYANDVVEVELHDGAPDINDPFGGMENGIVDISFSKDGKLTFKPGTGEVLTGTYTLKHNGLADTDFTVTLDNGETFSGTSAKTIYDAYLTFSFRGMQYAFDVAYRDAEEIYQEYISHMPDHIRRHVDSGYLKRATVSYNDGVYYLAEKGGDTLLLDDKVTVKCIRLNEEDTMGVLDSIEEGRCFSRIQKNKDGKSYILLYYIEPYPEEPPEPTEPKPLMLHECETQLTELNAEDVTEIKFTKEYTNLPHGYTRHHQYITDAAEIKSILDLLNDAELTEASGRFEATEKVTKLTLHIYTETGDFMIITTGSIYKHGTSDGIKYYTISDFPEFSYDGAVESFIDAGMTYMARINYDGNDLGEYILPFFSDIEFIVDTEDYDYTQTSPHWIYTFDFGEIRVYDETHFRYNGQNFVVVGDITIDLIYP